MIVLVFILAFLSGCVEIKTVPTPPPEEKILEYTRDEGNFMVWTDRQTKCQYFVFNGYNGRGGMTPRLKSNGEPWCNS